MPSPMMSLYLSVVDNHTSVNSYMIQSWLWIGGNIHEGQGVVRQQTVNVGDCVKNAPESAKISGER